VLAALSLGLTLACGPADSSSVSASPGYAPPSSGTWSPSSSAAAPPNPGPLVVVVDNDRTLSATPGKGVGVFTEYRTGGHWHVWWTCDTSVTNLPCSFEIGAAVVTGVISNLQTEGVPSQSSVSATPRQVTVSTVTTTELDGFTFDTTPGGSVEIDAQLNGARDGHFLFFVQDGIVNGGYAGTLSDPLVFSPAEP
jgi:hypothetical protein